MMMPLIQELPDDGATFERQADGGGGVDEEGGSEADPALHSQAKMDGQRTPVPTNHCVTRCPEYRDRVRTELRPSALNIWQLRLIF